MRVTRVLLVLMLFEPCHMLYALLIILRTCCESLLFQLYCCVPPYSVCIVYDDISLSQQGTEQYLNQSHSASRRAFVSHQHTSARFSVCARTNIACIGAIRCFIQVGSKIAIKVSVNVLVEQIWLIHAMILTICVFV